MTTSHVAGMSIGSTIASQVAMAAPWGTAASVARVLMERTSVGEAISTPSHGRLFNRWWVNSGLFETAAAGNAENRRALSRTYKLLRLNPRAIARRSSELAANPTAGGSSFVRSQVNPKTLPEIPEMPIIPGPLSLVLGPGIGRRLRPDALRHGGCGNCANAENVLRAPRSASAAIAFPPRA